MTSSQRNETRMPQDLAGQLEHMADHIADTSRADLQVMLRRAALMLKNAAPIGFDAEAEHAVRAISGELGMTRNDMIRQIVKE